MMMSGLTPQQQQLLLMRNQQYSNNSSGQESGTGTSSSNYTNATNSDLLHTNNTNKNPSQLQKQQSLAIAPTAHADPMLLAPPQLPRRKSLPSIVKTKSFKEDEKHIQTELYVIENGIRKRVTEKSNSALQQNKLGRIYNSHFNDHTVLERKAGIC